ncbi:hypothetical protein NDU88_006186 [Pleurodeles waltl]|uniref:Uncharacterized protein n=1 Tax=Pleurodeles waltl TaxID=8319 RepID=A0AAV7RKT3_PLEWA|nr:hypothetical protein NDU88_006186 [Pleurodeles waltl]KAJ1153427.1 hypothetical protein NDU88_006186 [Pleurodeles waltl]
MVTTELEAPNKERPRWQRDRSLLTNQQWVTDMAKFIQEFFQLNQNSASLFNVWEAYKTTARRQIIYFKAAQTRQRELQIKKLHMAIDKATDECMKSGEQEVGRCNLHQMRAKLKDVFILEEVTCSRAYQQQVYEESQKRGRHLAWTTHIKRKTSTVVNEDKDIARVFMSHYSRIYEIDYAVSLLQLDQYYKPVTLPKISSKVQKDVAQKIASSENKGAIQRIPSAKLAVAMAFQ